MNTHVSVIVVNYNKAKFIKRCIFSLKKQSYKNIEFIIIDDQSTDDSLKIIKKLQKKINFKLFITNSKTKYGSLNQINACKIGLKKSRGELIFFLDSDDFFKKDKILKVVNFYEQKKVNIITDKPIIYFNKKNSYKLIIKNRNTFLTPWPIFCPHSCIAIRRRYLNSFFNQISITRFPDLWIDFKILLQNFIETNHNIVLKEHLTFYQQSPNSISSKYKKFSLNWWRRRKSAHDYYYFLCKKNNVKFRISIDFLLTNFIYFFLK